MNSRAAFAATIPGGAIFGVFLGLTFVLPPVHGASPSFHIDPARSLDLNDGTLQCVAFSPDGRVVASCGDRLVQLFHVKSGELLQQLSGHADKVRSVAFSPNGKLLASGSDDKTILIWETATGKSVKRLKGGLHFPADFPVRCVAFLPDGKSLASCGMNNYVTFWDVGSGLWELKSWTNHADRGGLVHLAISANGMHCAVAGGVSRRLFASQVTLYDVDNGLKWRSNHEHDGEEEATHVSLSPDCTRMLSCGQDNSTRVWDVAKGSLLRKLPGPDGNKAMLAALFTPDNGHVVAVTSDGTLRVWSASDGSLLASIKVSDRAVLGLAISPDGATLATVGEDGAIQLWNMDKNLTRPKPNSADRE